jgi:competence protein ComEC
MGIRGLALAVALGGVAGGLLGSDVGLSPPLAAIIACTILCVLAGVVIGPSSRIGGACLLGCVLLVAATVGGWRYVSTDPERSTSVPSVAELVGGDEHELVGTVVDDPRPREDRVQLVLGDMVVGTNGGAIPLRDKLLVWMPRGIDAGSGDRIRIHTSVELAEDFDGFAYREYLARQGVGAIGRPRQVEVIAEAAGPGALLAGIRHALVGGLNDIVPEPEAALGAGILLGVRASIAPEINDAFATAGLTHVVAISGWNIAIVAALVAALVRPVARLPAGRWTSVFVSVAAVGGYVVLTGASPSVVRAAVMAGCMLVARLGGSRAHAASALELAALLMLLLAPPVLWDVGFQLSLLATAGIIWFGAPVERRLAAWPAWIREPVALTLAAQLTTLPVILVNFERLSLVAPLANVLVVPLVPLAMLCSAIASVVGVVDGTIHVPYVGDGLTWFGGGAAWLFLRVIIQLGTAVASIPHAAVDVKVPAPLAVAWLPILGLARWALAPPAHSARAETPAPDERTAGAVAGIVGRVLRPLPVVGVLLLILLTITVASRPDGRMHVTVLDIGQGDAILVETPGGAAMLIDGGPDPELTLRRLGANLPFFARRIDLMVLSHPHQDHVAGLVEILARFQVTSLMHAGIAYDNPAHHHLLADAVFEPRLSATLARAGHVVALDAATTVHVLYPTEADATGPLPEGDINNGSIVMLLRHGRFAALLTGDAEAPIEAILEARGLLSPVDMLKVGHHGSDSSTTAELLDVIRPTIAVISVGTGNEYGHPAPETLATLASRPEIAVFRTDLDGDVEIVSDGSSYQVRTDASGWSAPRPVHASLAAGSIDPWPSPTDPAPDACLPTPGCPTGSSSIPRVSPAWPWPPQPSWPRHRSRSTARWSRRRRSSTTSTRSRSGAAAARTASSGRAGSRRLDIRSSRCRSPPIRSAACSTTSDSHAAGPRSSSPSPTGTWPGTS